jgi:plastocyanin
MWLRSEPFTVPECVVATLFATTILASSPEALASASEIEETSERQAICAKAEARYLEIFPDASEPDGTVVVKLHKYTFCPPNLTVKKGTTVKWVNVDKRTSHSVWLKDAGVDESERFFPDEIWQHTFTEDGDYPYLCGPHWKEEDMRGYVKVTP